MSFSSLRFYRTPGVEGLQFLDVAAAMIAKHFAGKEDFLVFKYLEGRTVITNGNDLILASVEHRLFGCDVWVIYGEEHGFS